MVLPVYNEAETLRDFFGELVSAVEPLGFDIEAVFINDGSADDSLAAMREIKDEIEGRVQRYVSAPFGTTLCGVWFKEGVQ